MGFLLQKNFLIENITLAQRELPMGVRINELNQNYTRKDLEEIEKKKGQKPLVILIRKYMP